MKKNNKTKTKADLEKKVAELENKLDKSVAKEKGGHPFITALLVFITALIFCLSILAFWLRQSVFDTNTWVEKTSKIMSDGAVQQDIANASTQAIFNSVNVDQYVSDLLPDKAKPLANPISSSIKSFTEGQVGKLLASAQFMQFWKSANQQAHSAIIKTIDTANSKSQESATGEVIYIQKDKVFLNIAPVLQNIKGSLASSGLGFVNNINLSSINVRIELVTVKNLPLVLFVANTINSLAIWLPIIALLMALLTVYYSKNRRKTIVNIAYVSSGLLVLLMALISIGDYLFVSNVTNKLSSISSSSAQIIYSTLTSDLVEYFRAALAVMIIIAIFTYFTGNSVAANWIRNEINSLLRGQTNTPAYRWLNKYSNIIIFLSIFIDAFFIMVAPIKNAAFIITLTTIVGLVCVFLLAIKSKK